MDHKAANNSPKEVPLFKGTKVPIKALFDHIEAGRSLEEFLVEFPDVRKEQVNQVLAVAEQILAKQNSQIK